MIRFLFESGSLWAARAMVGDERVADYLLEQEYAPAFVMRHSNQLSSLLHAKYDPDD